MLGKEREEEDLAALLRRKMRCRIGAGTRVRNVRRRRHVNVKEWNAERGFEMRNGRNGNVYIYIYIYLIDALANARGGSVYRETKRMARETQGMGRRNLFYSCSGEALSLSRVWRKVHDSLSEIFGNITQWNG